LNFAKGFELLILWHPSGANTKKKKNIKKEILEKNILKIKKYFKKSQF